MSIHNGTRALSSVLKTFNVIDHLATLDSSAKLSEIAASLGEQRATVYQRLHTLIVAGWVEQLEDNSFRLSLRVSQVGNSALKHAGLDTRVLPFLEELTQKVGETSSLAVFVQSEVIIVQRVEADGILRAELRVGSSLTVSGSASGRILVAYASDAQIERLRSAGVELPSEDILKEIRATGFAISSGETMPEVAASAVPVFDAAGHCVGTVSLVGPNTRFNPQDSMEAIKAAGEQINGLFVKDKK